MKYYNIVNNIVTAICAGRTNLNNACNKHYTNDVIVYRPGSPGPQRDSGGECIRPDVCDKCNDGFYADGSYCRNE